MAQYGTHGMFCNIYFNSWITELMRLGCPAHPLFLLQGQDAFYMSPTFSVIAVIVFG